MSHRTHGSARSATLAGIGAIMLWSTTVAVSRSLAERLGPVSAAAAVFTVGGFLALLRLAGDGASRRRILQLPRRYLLVCGALFVAYMLLLFLAVGGAANRTQVLEVGLLNYLWPVLTLALSLPILGRRAKWPLAPGTILALAGIVLVVTHADGGSWRTWTAGGLGVRVLAVGAALAWALYSNLTRLWVGGADEGGVAVFLPATAAVLLIVGASIDEPRAWTLRAGAEAVFLGIATYAAYMLWDLAMRRGSIDLVVAASYLTPLFSTLASCLYLSVAPGARLWAGCGVLVLGSLLSWRAVACKASPPGVQGNPAGEQA